jgi:hypothetical protein
MIQLLFPQFTRFNFVNSAFSIIFYWSSNYSAPLLFALLFMLFYVLISFLLILILLLLFKLIPIDPIKPFPTSIVVLKLLDLHFSLLERMLKL